jgi:hypothetical protein
MRSPEEAAWAREGMACIGLGTAVFDILFRVLALDVMAKNLIGIVS